MSENMWYFVQNSTLLLSIIVFHYHQSKRSFRMLSLVDAAETTNHGMMQWIMCSNNTYVTSYGNRYVTTVPTHVERITKKTRRVAQLLTIGPPGEAEELFRIQALPQRKDAPATDRLPWEPAPEICNFHGLVQNRSCHDAMVLAAMSLMGVQCSQVFSWGNKSQIFQIRIEYAFLAVKQLHIWLASQLSPNPRTLLGHWFRLPIELLKQIDPIWSLHDKPLNKTSRNFQPFCTFLIFFAFELSAPQGELVQYEKGAAWPSPAANSKSLWSKRLHNVDICGICVSPFSWKFRSSIVILSRVCVSGCFWYIPGVSDSLLDGASNCDTVAWLLRATLTPRCGPTWCESKSNPTETSHMPSQNCLWSFARVGNVWKRPASELQGFSMIFCCLSALQPFWFSNCHCESMQSNMFTLQGFEVARHPQSVKLLIPEDCAKTWTRLVQHAMPQRLSYQHAQVQIHKSEDS